jgi:hypothetical protein
LNTGSTRSSAVLSISPIDFGKRYRFSHAKVVFNDGLASGESCIVGVNSQDGNGIVSNSETKTFSTDPGKHTVLFFKNPAGNSNDVEDFEEFSSISITAGKRPIKRFEVWAEPLQNEYQA